NSSSDVGPETRLEVAYGFDEMDIHRLAELLAQALGIRLYAQQSPMIGPWYSSAGSSGLTTRSRKGEPVVQLQRHLTVVLNDPEPGYTAPDYPRGGHLLLLVSGERQWLGELEAKLQAAGMPVRRLAKGESGD